MLGPASPWPAERFASGEIARRWQALTRSAWQCLLEVKPARQCDVERMRDDAVTAPNTDGDCHARFS